VLTAYYDLQELETRRARALEAETAYEQHLRELESCREQLEELQTQLEGEAPIAADAQQRSALQFRVEAEAVRRDSLEKSYAEWTECLLVRDGAEQNRSRLTRESQRLEKELQEARAYDRTRSLSERFARARERKERWESAHGALENTPALSRQAMEGLRSAASELQRLEGALSGGALSISVEARADLDLSAAPDLEEPKNHRLQAGSTWKMQARGRVRLEHRDWTLEVASGDGGLQETIRLHREAEARLQSLLRDSGLSSLEDAEEAHSRYQRLVLEVEGARREFEETLNGESWESLEAAAQSLPPNPPARAPQAIIEELAEVKARLGGLDESLRRAGERLSDLESGHESREALLRRMGEQSALVQELEKELSSLRALPEGVQDADAFLSRHRQNERELQSLRERQARLEITVDEALRRLPEETAEETAGRVAEARERFDRELRKAEALLRVLEATDRLLESLEDGGTDALRSLFGDYVQRLSQSRYRAAGSTALLPEALQRDDGTVLPYALLSAGTRDLFALALRLAMADLYLTEDSKGNGEGFLVMDDPLVDMDPLRQRLAAEVLARFASRRQLIIFTCHPVHADLLEAAVSEGGEQVSRLELTRD
jgi:exonuclease SbcC